MLHWLSSEETTEYQLLTSLLMCVLHSFTSEFKRNNVALFKLKMQNGLTREQMAKVAKAAMVTIVVEKLCRISLFFKMYALW